MPSYDQARVRSGSQLAAQVRNVEFPAALRGYDRAAVDAYVTEVARLVEELEAKRSPEAAVRRALDRVGEETSGILQRARETADDITARSRAQAADRIEQAEREAEALVREAELRVRELEQDVDAVWQDRNRLVDDVRRVSEELLAVAETAAERYPAEDDEDGDEPFDAGADATPEAGSAVGSSQLPPATAGAAAVGIGATAGAADEPEDDGAPAYDEGPGADGQSTDESFAGTGRDEDVDPITDERGVAVDKPDAADDEASWDTEVSSSGTEPAALGGEWAPSATEPEQPAASEWQYADAPPSEEPAAEAPPPDQPAAEQPAAEGASWGGSWQPDEPQPGGEPEAGVGDATQAVDPPWTAAAPAGDTPAEGGTPDDAPEAPASGTGAGDAPPEQLAPEDDPALSPDAPTRIGMIPDSILRARAERRQREEGEPEAPTPDSEPAEEARPPQDATRQMPSAPPPPGDEPPPPSWPQQ